MAVVEKKPEVKTASPFDRLGMASLAGVVYLIASLAVAFKAVPAVCQLVGITSDLAYGPFLSATLSLVALVVLAVVGYRLMGGASSRPGLRAGIFVGLVFLLLWVFVSRWIGGLFEGWTYGGWFAGNEVTVGGGIAAVLSLLLGFWLLRIFLRPTFEPRLVSFEGAGWFNFRTYKPGQGLRVRRGTILGILLMAVSGIWVMMNHRLLEGGSPDWKLNVPFTGREAVSELGDALRTGQLNDTNAASVRVLDPGSAKDELTANSTVERDLVVGVMAPLVEKKRKSLQDVIAKLEERKKALLQSIAGQTDPSAKIVLQEEEVRLSNWIEKLQAFEKDLAPGKNGAISDRVLLIQKEIDQFILAEQDRERERRRADQGARTRRSLEPEMDLIVKWAHEDPLPVAGRVMSRFALRDVNSNLDPLVYRVVNNPAVFEELPPGELRDKFQQDRVVHFSDFRAGVEKLKEVRVTQEEKDRAEEDARRAAPEARPMKGTPYYASLMLLPAVKYTVPLLLLVLAVWFAWRVVNLPTFADFLIATEAEMKR